MSSDFNHCLDTRVHKTEKQRGIRFYVASEKVDLFIVPARISQLSMYEVNINTADFRATGTDDSVQNKLRQHLIFLKFNNKHKIGRMSNLETSFVLFM